MPNKNVKEEVCAERHKRVDEKLDCYETDIQAIKNLLSNSFTDIHTKLDETKDSVNKKFIASLVFLIITLITLLIELIKNGFRF